MNRFDYRDAQGFPDFVRFFIWNDPLLQQGVEVPGVEYKLTIEHRRLCFRNHLPDPWTWRVQLLVVGEHRCTDVVAATFRQPFHAGPPLVVPSSAWWFEPQTVVTWLTAVPSACPAPEFFMTWFELLVDMQRPTEEELSDLWVGIVAAEDYLQRAAEDRIAKGTPAQLNFSFGMLRRLAEAVGLAMLKEIAAGKIP